MRFTHVSQFNSDNTLQADASAFGECNESAVGFADFVAPYNLVIYGAKVAVKGAKFGDTVSFQVFHPSGAVISEFVKDWGVVEDSQFQFEDKSDEPANIPAGVIIRAVYKANDVVGKREFFMNMKIKRVL